MKNRNLILFITIALFQSISFCVGPESLTFPTDVQSLALSGSGVGGSYSIDINPATITGNDFMEKISFTHSRWFSDIFGVNIRYSEFWKLPIIVDLTNWESGDIGEWGDVPQDDPIGTISLHWVSAGLTTGFQKNDWNFGLRLKGHFGRMVIESITGYTFDFGVQRSYSNVLSAGMAIKNLGSFTSGELEVVSPTSYAFGIKYQEPVAGINLLADIVHEKSHEAFLRIGIERSFKNITIMSGMIFSNQKHQYSFGTEYNVGKWNVGYGIAFHENSILGTPQFFTIGRSF